MESLICDHPGRVAARSLAQANPLCAWWNGECALIHLFTYYLFSRMQLWHWPFHYVMQRARERRPAMNGRWRGMRFIYASVSHLAHIIDHKNNTLLRYAYTYTVCVPINSTRAETRVEADSVRRVCKCVRASQSTCVWVRADKFEW